MITLGVNDIIVYKGDIESEVDRCQKIEEIINGIIIKSIFLDNGEKNQFRCDSNYHLDCVHYEYSEYDNGVPVIWE